MKHYVKLCVLVLPVIALCMLATYHAIAQAQTPRQIFQIEGYDPRDLLRGRYLQFRYIWPAEKAEQYKKMYNEAGRYYLPENKAKRVEGLLREGKMKFAVEVTLTDKAITPAMLLIDGQPWHKIIDNLPDCAPGQSDMGCTGSAVPPRHRVRIVAPTDAYTPDILRYSYDWSSVADTLPATVEPLPSGGYITHYGSLKPEMAQRLQTLLASGQHKFEVDMGGVGSTAPYFIQAYIDGKSLKEWLAEQE